MTGKQQGGPDRGNWWLALAAIPILCCVGPAVFAAFVAGGGVAAAGAATGNATLAVIGALLAAVALAVVLRRAQRR